MLRFRLLHPVKHERSTVSRKTVFFFEASLASAVDFESVGMYPDTGIIFR